MLTITGRSHSAGLLLNATTGLSSLSLDIAEASIHTESDGTVRDEFVVRKSGRRTGEAAAQLPKDDFEEVEVRKKRRGQEEIRGDQRSEIYIYYTHPRSTTHPHAFTHTLIPRWWCGVP